MIHLHLRCPAKLHSSNAAPAAVRFTEESVQDAEPDMVSQPSAIGPIALAPSKGEHGVDVAMPEVPEACADFGILREGHTWRASAGTVPSGTTIKAADAGTVIQDVRIGSNESTDGTASILSAQDESLQHILVIIKPQGVGPFEDVVKVCLAGPQGAEQQMNIRAEGQVMGVGTGTPMVKHGVHCQDPA